MESLHRAEWPVDATPQRLDRVLATLFAQYSRSRLQQWIKSGAVSVDGETVVKQRAQIAAGSVVILRAEAEVQGEWLAEAIPLGIIYEDSELLVVNKPVGLVVHPAAGHSRGTLLNALLHHAPQLQNIPRAGIIHRLDKETSGLLMVAKTATAHHALVDQLQQRSVRREYRAIVHGEVTGGGTVNAPIGRHPVDRKRMAVTPSGKEAVTHYRLLHRLRGFAHLSVHLESGRTHQIRVHMASIHHPLVGDPLYGGRQRLPCGASDALLDGLRGFRHQALHATLLGILHPVTGAEMVWQVPPPPDFEQLLQLLLRECGDG
ncbi:MAG: 23S rRNA pseudouridine(1911/1915/1917) synthase RluD [Gammaproteobacteria bacterium]|nr:23S rRNA pseudouridine(1911/1915/1917) synthase RluD [Gammaproteobacteria bacterium]